jgi:hypothetical protein
MGHLRLNTLPDTVPWRHVVALLAEDGDVAAVAMATTQAALRGLDLAKDDPGLVQSFLLLSRIVLAARQPQFADALNTAGIPVAPDPGVFDIVGGFSDAIDEILRCNHGRSDIGEMAQLACAESLTALLTERAANLYETTAAEVRDAAYRLSTQTGFATLAHDFFARFTQRFLTYHLGRELSNHVGGNGRFADPNEHNEFVAQLATHCREAAAIMRRYAGEWHSKATFEGGVTEAKVRRFVNHVLKKLAAELLLRGQRDGE